MLDPTESTFPIGAIENPVADVERLRVHGEIETRDGRVAAVRDHAYRVAIQGGDLANVLSGVYSLMGGDSDIVRDAVKHCDDERTRAPSDELAWNRASQLLRLALETGTLGRRT